MTTDGGRGPVPALVLAGVAVGTSQTIVLSVLPVAQRWLGVGVSAGVWVLTVFMLVGVVATPIAGRVGDMFGYRRAMVVCAVFFVVGSLVAAVGAEARSFALVLIGRAVSGVSSGVFPLAFGMARAVLPVERVRHTSATLSATFGLGGSLGMVVAGPITDLAGPTAIFWLALALALVTLAVTRVLPAVPGTGRARVDVVGAALLSTALVALLLVISQGSAWGWTSPGLLALAAVTVLAFVGFLATESRVANPLIQPRLLRHRSVAALNAATVLSAITMFGLITLVPRLAQTDAATGFGFGLSATMAGVILLPMGAVMVLTGPFATRVGTLRGSLRVGVALALVTAAFLAVEHSATWHLVVGGLIIGVGYGFAFGAVGALVVESVDRHETGVASAMNTVARTLGATVGAQLAAAVLGAHGAVPAESGYSAGFWLFAGTAVVALISTAAVTQRNSKIPATV